MEAGWAMRSQPAFQTFRISNAPALPFRFRQTRLRFHNTLSSIDNLIYTAFGLVLLDFLCRRYHRHSDIHSTGRVADLEMICAAQHIHFQASILNSTSVNHLSILAALKVHTLEKRQRDQGVLRRLALYRILGRWRQYGVRTPHCLQLPR